MGLHISNLSFLVLVAVIFTVFVILFILNLNFVLIQKLMLMLLLMLICRQIYGLVTQQVMSQSASHKNHRSSKKFHVPYLCN